MAEKAESSINQRINFLINNVLRTNTHKLSKLLNVSDGTLRNYVDGKSKPGADFLELMLERIDGLNATWLLTGKEEPIKTGSISISEESVSTYGNILKNVPNSSVVNLGIVSQEHSSPTEEDRNDGMVILTVREYQLLISQLHDKERIIQLLENQLKSASL